MHFNPNTIDLTQTQLQVWEVLDGIDSNKKGYRYHQSLSSMYYGGHCLRLASIPEHYQASAHCFRELLEKLQRSTQTRVGSVSHDKVMHILDTYRNYSLASDETLQKSAHDSLMSTLEEVSTWADKNLSSERTSELLDGLGGRKGTLSGIVRHKMWGKWRKLHRYFIDVSHHGLEPENFDDKAAGLDELLLDLLRTSNTAETMIDVFKLIEEAEA